MKKIFFLSAASLLLSCFISHMAIAFDQSKIPHSLPYTYNGVTYDKLIAGKRFMSDWVVFYAKSDQIFKVRAAGTIITSPYSPITPYFNCPNDTCPDVPSGFQSNFNVYWQEEFCLSEIITSSNVYAEFSEYWTNGQGCLPSGTHFDSGDLIITAGQNMPKLLTVNVNPSGGGTVTSSPGSLTCANGACTGSFSGNISVMASANSGYQFLDWYENGSVITNNCPATMLNLTMNAARTISAEFLPVFKWPLTGPKSSRNESLTFGDTWTFGECPTGTYKKHTGIDVNATAEEEVYAAHNGVVRKIYTGQHSQWADAIVVESNDGRFTTVYWHVTKYRNLSENDTVTKGQQIAKIARLGANTHFHFGVRFSAFSDPESYAGALPVAGCGGYLAYPEKFLNPDSLTYE